MELYVLLILFVLAGVCLHLNIINKNKPDFDIVLRIALVFLMAHAAVAFIGRALPQKYWYIDWAAPFGLIYGPLLYIGYLSYIGSLPERKKIRIHIFPFLVAVPCYIIFLFFPHEEGDPVRFIYIVVLYSAMALSWLVYAALVTFLVTKRKEKTSLEFKNLVSSIVIILFTLAVFFMIMVYTRAIKLIKTSTLTSALMIYLGMFSGVVLIYRYTVRRFKESHSDGAEASRFVTQKEETEPQKPEYRKSSLKEEVMTVYSEKVTAFIDSGAYLDIDLSLGKIAAELRIPKHHLSQLFSQYYKQGFLEYVNRLRIHHACSILSNTKTNVNIADLAEQCGFKSKPSFYRNFKAVTGMTPTEFQSSLK